ncbi:MAG TPA: hypothetical protein VKG62_00130 [Solirubrobacteraceae bacterium]|nr:hypothetical protein [Solirubrobacteraceae bacterium]
MMPCPCRHEVTAVSRCRAAADVEVDALEPACALDEPVEVPDDPLVVPAVPAAAVGEPVVMVVVEGPPDDSPHASNVKPASRTSSEQVASQQHPCLTIRAIPWSLSEARRHRPRPAPGIAAGDVMQLRPL